MSETKDPAIKLFGKTIQLPEPAAASGCGGNAPPAPGCGGNASAEPDDVSGDDSLVQDRPCTPNYLPEDSNLDGSGVGEESEKIQDLSGGRGDESKTEDGDESMMVEELTDPLSSYLTKENSEAQSVDTEAAPAKSSKAEDEQNGASNSQDKLLKKPDKILPCPRCNSMDTKFCYYNNYNTNQPRHFCKNCQRYWTAGGTMRNVPVGAGRRKNKNSVSQYRHTTVSEALQNSQVDLPNGIHYPTPKSNGTVLTFGSDAPLCESMASVLNIADKTIQNCSRNGFHGPEELKIPFPYGTGANGDERLSGSSVTSTSSKDEAGQDGLPDKLTPNCQSIPPQVPSFPGAPWPYSWNSGQWNSSVPPAAFCPAGYPMPFYPVVPYWAVPGTWTVPWLNPPPTSQNLNSQTSGPNSPTLGKHLRDDNIKKPVNSKKEVLHKESNPEKCLWVPKTLRIDDPEEAAKSSILATLGIKSDKVYSIGGGGLFKAFQSKGDEDKRTSETATVLQANPAALSRSLSFHETS